MGTMYDLLNTANIVNKNLKSVEENNVRCFKHSRFILFEYAYCDEHGLFPFV